MTIATIEPPRQPEPVFNLLTVDLEDWFHICEVETLLPRSRWDALPSTVVPDTERLLDLLCGAGAHATFFVLGYVARRHPDLVRRIDAMGHEVAYHGMDHELVYELTPERFRRILRDGIQVFEDVVGTRPIGFRAPQWSINGRSPWALEILAEEGFEYDSSLAPLRFVGSESQPKHPHQQSTRSGNLWEFPPHTLWTPWGRYPAAGGWGLRCIPFGVLKRSIQRLNGTGIPAVLYFHPREFGTNRAVPGLPLGKRFVLHAGIWSTATQLNRLISSFSFTSVARYLNIREQKRRGSKTR